MFRCVCSAVVHAFSYILFTSILQISLPLKGKNVLEGWGWGVFNSRLCTRCFIATTSQSQFIRANKQLAEMRLFSPLSFLLLFFSSVLHLLLEVCTHQLHLFVAYFTSTDPGPFKALQITNLSPPVAETDP